MKYDLTDCYKDGDYYVSCFNGCGNLIIAGLVYDINESGLKIDRATAYSYIGETIIYGDRYFHTLTNHQTRCFDRLDIRFASGIRIQIKQCVYLHVISDSDKFDLDAFLFHKTDESAVLKYRLYVFRKIREKFPDISIHFLHHMENTIRSRPDNSLEEFHRMERLIETAGSEEEVLEAMPDARPRTIEYWHDYISENFSSQTELDEFVYCITKERNFRLYKNETLYDFIKMALSLGADPNYLHKETPEYPKYDSILQRSDIHSLRLLFENGGDPNLLVGEKDDPNAETVFEYYDRDLEMALAHKKKEAYIPILCAAYGGRHRNGLESIHMYGDHSLEEIKHYENKSYRVRYTKNKDGIETGMVVSIIDKKDRSKIAEYIKIWR